MARTAEERDRAIAEIQAALSPANRQDALRAAKLYDDETDEFQEWLNDVSPHMTWDWRHLVYLREKLHKVTTGEIKKLAIFLPPRHGKTTMTTIHYPAFRLEKDPTMNLMICAYNDTLARRFSRKIQEIAGKRTTLNPKKKAAEYWETIVGGGLRPAGVGAGITGMGANLIIIDDPVKNREEANSATFRDRVWDWYTDDLFTRREPDASTILVMTRWHEDDLAGRILSSDDGPNWTVVNLPAIAEENDELGREIGEALCPERYDIDALREAETVLGKSFHALYQQTPKMQEGEMFKASWFTFIKRIHVPTADDGHRTFVRYWDKAGTKDDGAYTAGVLMMLCNMRVYVLDIVFGQWESSEREKMIIKTAIEDRERNGFVSIGVEQEPGSGGKESAEATEKALRQLGFSVFLDKVTGAKELRAEPFANASDDGKVSLVKASWNRMYIDALTSFPNSTKKDLVDASSGGFNFLAQYMIDWDSILALGINESYYNRWV